MKKLKAVFGVLFISVLGFIFVNCSSGSSGNSGNGQPNQGQTDGSLVLDDHVTLGYYLEDATNNPEDPMPGFFKLQIPDSGAFSGSFWFSYIGCQSSSVGTISGLRNGNNLTGSWNGTVDGTQQGGNYAGSLTSPGMFKGTYTNTNGKVHISIPNCIDYYIASHGTWMTLTPSEVIANGFKVTAKSISASAASFEWVQPADTVFSVVTIFDLEYAQTGQQPMDMVRMSEYIAGNTFDTAQSAGFDQGLVPNRSYGIFISSFDNSNNYKGSGFLTFKLAP